jgi:bile acid:Na+ symporter, BASS family
LNDSYRNFIVMVFVTVKKMDNLMKRAITLLTIYLVAAVFDWGAGLSFLIRYMLMTLLFFAFLKVDRINKPDIGRVLSVLFSMFFIGFGAYFLLLKVNQDIAEAALMVAITPTALASIVIIDILGGNKSHAASNVLVTNIFIVFALPFLMPLIVPDITLGTTIAVLRSTLITFFLPYIAALIAKQYMRRATVIINSKNISFYIWAFLMYLSVSKSVYFLKYNNTVSTVDVIFLVIIVLGLCIINFIVGKMIGGERYSLETSLALGHKNNGFGVWFCLTYINPFVALGPSTYVLFQNLFLIFLMGRKKSHNLD